jgi:hypothetical protein
MIPWEPVTLDSFIRWLACGSLTRASAQQADASPPRRYGGERSRRHNDQLARLSNKTYVTFANTSGCCSAP